MRRLLRIFKARGLLLGLVLALSVAGGALFQLNYVNASLAATPWPMYQHDVQHTGRSPYSGPASPWLKWSYTTGNFVYSSPAIGSDGTIYVGNDENRLYAISDNGSPKWHYATVGVIRSAPAIGSDGTIYVTSDDNKLYAISDNGSFKWSYTTGSNVETSPAIGSDGTIYFGSPDHKLYAISDNSSLKWSYTTGSPVWSSPAISSDGTTIYVGSEDNKLYAISDNGSFKWSYTTGGNIDASPAIGSDGTIYIGSDDHKLYAISDNGSFKWSYTTGNNIYSSPAIGSDGTIYVSSSDSTLYAINPGGSFKWSYTTGNSIDSSPAIGSDGTIYVGSYDHKLYAINPTNGSLKWSYTTGNSINSSPAIGSDGTIYIGSGDNKLYAIMQQPAPTVTSVNPNSGNQGQTLNNVTITGTYFTGATAVSFGAGITVTGFIVNSATQITDNITIAAGATPGTRNVSVTTPGGTATLNNGFTVNQPTQSVSTATGTGTATFTTSKGSIVNLTASATTPCGSLTGFSVPHGYFSFNITNITAGATVTITITLPSDMPTSTQYWKCINGQWVNVTSLLGDNDGDNVLTLTLTDGGLGDADGVANGTIVDPGAPAIAQAQAPAAHQVSPTLPNQIKPAQMSLQYLSLTPQQTSANQPVTILTNVVNTGDEAGSLNIALKINGQIEQQKMVSVGPQATQPVKFTVTKAEPGTYAVDVGGQKGSFIINGAGSTTTSKSASGGMIVILIFGVLILATVVVLVATRRHPA